MENESQRRIFRYWQVFLIEIFLFSSPFILALSTVLKFQQKFPEIFKREITLFRVSPLEFIFSFLLATIFIFLVPYIFKSKKRIFFKTLFIFAIFINLIYLFSFWFSLFVSLILTFLLMIWWLKIPRILNHNLLIILGLTGIGIFFGFRFNPEILILLLIFFSFYDILAVYKIKHMVKMAKEMIESKVIFGLIIPQKISEFKESLKNVQPGGKFFILGGGDVAFPLFLSVSLARGDLEASIIVTIFSIFGLLANFLILLKQKERKPIPALPLISLFSIIGYLITKIL